MSPKSEQSGQISELFHDPMSLGEALFGLAQFYLNEGAKDKALNNLTFALKYFKQVQATNKISKVERMISSLNK
jgi:hypothetical protein